MNRPGQSLLSRLSFSRPEKRVAKSQALRASTGTLLGLLGQLRSGYLLITLPNEEVKEFGNRADQLHAEIQVLDWSVFKQVLSHGDIGFAESYIRGQWNTPDLKAVLELAIRNRTILEKAIYGSWMGSIAYRLKHWLRDNSKSGSRKNIHAHYDLGNAFGHIALLVEDIYKTCNTIKDKGGKVVREPGPMKFGTTILAFVEDPNGYKIELIQAK